MITIDPQIVKQYDLLLEERKVPSAQHNYYRKWIRYYLDFCSKYRLPDTSSKNLTQFLSKLREKKQLDAQVKQALMPYLFTLISQSGQSSYLPLDF